MYKMGDILNNYMEQIEQNVDYVSYDILESEVSNPNSVEAMYQLIEKHIEHNMNVVEFKSLKTLESEYDKVYPWFDKNFDKKITDLV